MAKKPFPPPATTSKPPMKGGNPFAKGAPPFGAKNPKVMKGAC